MLRCLIFFAPYYRECSAQLNSDAVTLTFASVTRLHAAAYYDADVYAAAAIDAAFDFFFADYFSATTLRRCHACFFTPLGRPRFATPILMMLLMLCRFSFCR